MGPPNERTIIDRRRAGRVNTRTSETSSRFRCLRHLVIAALLPLAVGCSPSAGTQPAAPEGATKASGDASVMVDSVNYRHDRAMRYTLYDLRTGPPRAVGGGIVNMLASGGNKGCCIELPTTWRPGMKVRVTWEEGDWEQMFPEQHVRDLEIPRYDSPADLVVVFYAGHEVEVIVSAAEVGHPEWKGRIKKTPWDVCVEEVGRKVCKATIPNYGGLSLEEMTGVCHAENIKLGDCQYFIDRCTHDYEDRAVCEQIVWKKKK